MDQESLENEWRPLDVQSFLIPFFAESAMIIWIWILKFKMRYKHISSVRKQRRVMCIWSFLSCVEQTQIIVIGDGFLLRLSTEKRIRKGKSPDENLESVSQQKRVMVTIFSDCERILQIRFNETKYIYIYYNVVYFISWGGGKYSGKTSKKINESRKVVAR